MRGGGCPIRFQRSKSTAMLAYRLISGSCLIALVLSIFWLDSRLDTWELTQPWRQLFAGRPILPAGLLILLLCLLVLPLAAIELRNIFRMHQVPSSARLITLATICTVLTMYATPMQFSAPTGIAIIASVLVGCFIGTLIWHSRNARIQGAIAAAGATMFAVTYLGLMGGFYVVMRRNHAAWVVLAVLLTTKACDIGAYFTGRMIGRHKLIPWLSPGKTWEGLLGGIAFSCLAAAGFAYLSQVTDVATYYRTVEGQAVAEGKRYNPAIAAIGGVLLAVVGHIGDLTMSLFKRDAGLKDSGSIIPGMGGILDVIDSPLLAAPVAYWMLELASN